MSIGSRSRIEDVLFLNYYCCCSNFIYYAPTIYIYECVCHSMIVEVRRQLCGVTSLLYLCGFHQISRLAGKLYPLSNMDVPALFFVEEKPVAKCGPFMASTKSLEAKGF